MTPEEKFNQDVWWILQEIKKEQLATPKGEKVYFSLKVLPKTSSIRRKDVDYGFPQADTQRKLLYKLKEWKALDLQPTGADLDNIFSFNPATSYPLTILKKFNELYQLYESGGFYSENQESLAEISNSQSIIKPKSLELIAREIGDLDSGSNLVGFLVNCGVKRELIEYPNTKWRMVYSVLLTLAISPNPKNQETLFKIIEEASHPLMHDGNEELAKKYEDKFNKLLKYDGFALRNYKLKRISKEAEQDNDLDLYLKKKILVENWRDDVPHPITELSFNNNTVEQICYSLWDLFIPDIIFFGANTSPENILIETDPRFHKEIAFNWNLIRDLDNNPHKVEADYGFEIEILNEKRLKQDIEDEINEFVSNKVEKEKIEKQKDFYPDTKFPETPSYLRGISANYYVYKKQKEILLNFIANLYNKFENEILVIKFNEIEDKNVNVLRTVMALENEGFFTIKELRNDKKEWIDKDNVYTKIQLVKSKIPIIKKFVSITDKQNQEIKSGTGSELLSSPHKKQQEPFHIVIDEVKKDIGIRGLEEKIVLQKPKNKRIQLRKFPADTKWDEIIIQFLNDHEVIVKVKNETHQTTYEAMGFQDEKKKLPNKQWEFLRLLAFKSGEISWENNRDLSLQQINSIKKQKQLLTEALKAYFQIYDDEPFYDYKKEKAYKIKLNLIPESNTKRTPNEQEIFKEDDELGIKESYKEQTPEIYEE